MTTNKQISQTLIHLFGLFFLLLLTSFVYAQDTNGSATLQLNNVKYIPLPNDELRVDLVFNKTLPYKPKRFLLKNPARLIIDLPKVSNKISSKKRDALVDIGVLNKFTALEASGRTRLVMGLKQSVSYHFKQDHNIFSITLSGPKRSSINMSRRQHFITHQKHAKANPDRITDIDFSSGAKGNGKVIIKLSDVNIGADVVQRGSNITVTFFNTYLPKKLQRKYDVTDFATPVDKVLATNQGGNVQLTVKTRGLYQQIAYQVDNKFVIDVQRITEAQKRKAKRKVEHFTGKRISLNFQNISVRAVLQLLAEFTHINMVVSDTVKGDITLQLHSVPWDQALDIIMKTRALDKRQYGSVILIAPAAEIATREKEELQVENEVAALMPLRSELLQINYAKARTIASLLKAKDFSLLSDRGKVSVDERTNTLWIQDTPNKLNEIRTLVTRLDVPVRQVLIEARVVTVDKDFEHELGIRFGVTHPEHLTGTLEGANQLQQNILPEDIPIDQRLNINLPVVPTSGTAPSIGLALAKLGSDTLLDLELSALESEGRGDVIASPRLITANQQPAMIEAGEEIPYQEATSSGATSIAFKKAVLSLKVTPQITPDHKIILDLKINQDRASSQLFNGVPAIITKEIETKVLVNNGQTIVLGGVYTRNRTSDVRRVPFLGTLPVVGVLFRNVNNADEQEELLIFITPKIITQYASY